MRRGVGVARRAPVVPAPPTGTDPSKLLVVACGALAREIAAVVAADRLDYVALHCLPAMLHNYPDRIAPAVEAVLEVHEGPAFVAYADCGTGGALRAVCDRHGAEMLPGTHCYAVFEGVDAFAARGETDAFYLTDFLARQFHAFVIRPLGLDCHPELRDTYFGHYARVVHLAQTDDAETDDRARAAAATLGLAFERRWTGYGDLGPALRATDGRGLPARRAS